MPGIGGLPAPKPGPNPYKDVITDKAMTCHGLFTVHKVVNKFYFEIADSIRGREIYAIMRFSKVLGGAGVYGGGEVNSQVLDGVVVVFLVLALTCLQLLDLVQLPWN